MKWFATLSRSLDAISAKQLKRIAVAIVGGTVLLIGIALVVLPGPAFLVIPAGLAILATEFVWARRLLHHTKGQINKFRRKKSPPPSTSSIEPSSERT